MVCKNGEGEHKWIPNVVTNSYGSGVWKGIRKGWDSFERHISFDIGNGAKVRFWKDKWCGELELWRLFPSLFNLAVDKDCLVSSVLQVEEGRVVWNPIFRRNLGIGVGLPFFAKLYSQQIDSSRDDKVRWATSSSKKFSVKSYFYILPGRGGFSFPWKTVWKSISPSRVDFFAWEASYEAILTGDNLHTRRKVYINWCFMCKGSGESVLIICCYIDLSRQPCEI